jgi:hypothetical protein
LITQAAKPKLPGALSGYVANASVDIRGLAEPAQGPVAELMLDYRPAFPKPHGAQSRTLLLLNDLEVDADELHASR